MVTRKRMIQINRESVRMTYKILHDKLSFGTVFRRITCFLEIVYSVIHVFNHVLCVIIVINMHDTNRKNSK